MMIKNGLILFALTLCLSGCGTYQQVLKSTDQHFKYDKAIEYFNNEEYVKSQTLLEEVSPYFKGTEKAQEVIIYLGRSYFGQENYLSAADYYQAYIRNYPKGRYHTEARFQTAHCYYLESPDARLDQEITRKAIEHYNQFVEMFPESPYAQQAYKEMNELYDKLAYKEFLSAKLYYNLGSYLGNNYLSCEITAKNALKDYPNNSYCEELNWLIFTAKYQQMVNSFEAKKVERAREAADEYYSFINQFPESKHLSTARRMFKEINKITNE